MGRLFAPLVAAVFLISSCTANAQTRQLQGSRQDGTRGDSFEDRMQMYSQWASFASAHGRSLNWWAESPSGLPVYIPPNGGGGSNGVTGSGSSGGGSSDSSSGGYTSVVQPVTGDGSVQAGLGARNPGGGGGCKVLRYHTGYANTTLYYNRTILDTPNFGECCHHCQNDSLCVAWTRVAGGDPDNFRKCYLKYSFSALDRSPQRTAQNHEGHTGDTARYPELRYVNTDSPVILESGTIPDEYPADYYGCPYSPGNPTTPCVAPPGCNVNGQGVFVAPPCIE